MNPLLPDVLKDWEWPQAVLDSVVYLQPQIPQLIASPIYTRRYGWRYSLMRATPVWEAYFSPETTDLKKCRSKYGQWITIMYAIAEPDSSYDEVLGLCGHLFEQDGGFGVALISWNERLYMSILPRLHGILRYDRVFLVELAPGSEFIPLLLDDLKFDYADSILQLYTNWQCAFYAAEIYQRLEALKMQSFMKADFFSMYYCQNTPEEADELRIKYCDCETRYLWAWANYRDKLNSGTWLRKKPPVAICDERRRLYDIIGAHYFILRRDPAEVEEENAAEAERQARKAKKAREARKALRAEKAQKNAKARKTPKARKGRAK